MAAQFREYRSVSNPILVLFPQKGEHSMQKQSNLCQSQKALHQHTTRSKSEKICTFLPTSVLLLLIADKGVSVGEMSMVRGKKLGKNGAEGDTLKEERGCH